MKKMKLFCLGIALISITGLFASEKSWAEDPTHNELRALRDGLIDAVNKTEIEKLIANLHPNVAVTWQNAEISRGQDGVRNYLSRMLNGPSKIVQSFSTSINVDELTQLYGTNTGVAFGSSVDHFKLAGGLDFDLKGRWTATLVRENDKWTVAAFHASSNLFDNALLNAAKASTLWIASGTGVLCLILGMLLAKLFWKPKSQ